MANINQSLFSLFYKSNLVFFLKVCFATILATGSQFLITPSAEAGEALSTKETFQGKVNYTVTGGTLRNKPDNIDACSLKGASTGRLSGIPDDGTVKKAYLYWSGSGDTVDNQITFDGTSLTADNTYTEYFSLLNLDFFQGVKDVTDIVSVKGNGNYSFKDLSVTNTGGQCNSKATLSAWSLIVIYDDPSIDRYELNTIKMYEGFTASRNETVDYTLDGIQVANNPNAKFSMLLWEGDESLGGSNEYFSFNDTILTDEYNPINTQFNSSINTLGLSDVYGVDLDTFDVSNYVSPGDTEVTGLTA